VATQLDSIQSAWLKCRLKLTFHHVYKLTKFVLDHGFHCVTLGGSPCIAEYRDTGSAVLCGVHPMAQTDHKHRKASL
jgi:hypothetical protein